MFNKYFVRFEFIILSYVSQSLFFEVYGSWKAQRPLNGPQSEKETLFSSLKGMGLDW